MKSFLILDTETTNNFSSPLVYDVGYIVCNKRGRVLKRESLIIAEVFLNKKLMQFAFYANKIPQYIEKLSRGESRLVTLAEAKAEIQFVIEKWHIEQVCAYNAGFDTNALRTTIRYITKSEEREFFPSNVEVWCIWHIACQLLCNNSKYYNFCHKNGFVSAKGNIQTSAEIVHRFLTNDFDFIESHTGLEDAEIETKILLRCMKNKKFKEIKKGIHRMCWKIPQKNFPKPLDKIEKV